MQQDVAAALLDLLSGLKAGPPRPHTGAFWTVALDGLSHGEGPLEMVREGGLDLAEADPPAADRIIAVNRTPRAIVAYPGDVIGGGFATRAVVDAALVPPGGERWLRVEAIDSRWWLEGPPVPVGSLAPMLALALELARQPRGDGLAAVARTALWSMMAAAPFLEADEPEAAPRLSTRGWVLGDAAGVIGATVFRHHRFLARMEGAAIREGPTNAWRGVPDRVHRYLGELLAAVARSSSGAVEAGLRPLIAGGAVLGVSAVRPDPDLILRLARGAAA